MAFMKLVDRNPKLEAIRTLLLSEGVRLDQEIEVAQMNMSEKGILVTGRLREEHRATQEAIGKLDQLCRDD